MTDLQDDHRPAESRPEDELELLRLAVGLGDPQREWQILPALGVVAGFRIVERCLAADSLLACVRENRVDVALAAFDLHRLSRAALQDLAGGGTPLVLLAPQPEAEEWRGLAAAVLPLDASPDAVAETLHCVAHGPVRPLPGPYLTGARPADPSAPGADTGDEQNILAEPMSVIAVASGHGSPGRTTVAINLAAGLGAVAPTILVDLDVCGPTIAACLDADPTRNLFMVAHAEPRTHREWERAVAGEVQPLGARSPQGVVLCGLPKIEMRAALADAFLEQLIAALRKQYRYVVLDIGADLLGADVTLHRTALRLADPILLVASADLPGVWHACTALRLLDAPLGIPLDHVALVVNGHDPEYHHSRQEIEWALGRPTAAIIPYDHRACQQALALQRPAVFGKRRPAARALLDLAGRIHQGKIVLPPEPARRDRLAWPQSADTSVPEQKGSRDGQSISPAD